MPEENSISQENIDINGKVVSLQELIEMYKSVKVERKFEKKSGHQKEK